MCMGLGNVKTEMQLGIQTQPEPEILKIFYWFPKSWKNENFALGFEFSIELSE